MNFKLSAAPLFRIFFFCFIYSYTTSLASDSIPQVLSKADSSKVVLKKSTAGFIDQTSNATFFKTDTLPSSGDHEVNVYGMISSNKNIPIFLSTYEEEGAIAEIKDAFVGNDKSAKVNLFVICAWRDYHRTETVTIGYDYKIYVYKNKISKGEGGYTFAERNDSLEKIFGEGFDGTRDNEDVTFAFKTRKSILDKLGAKSIGSSHPTNSDVACYQIILASFKSKSLDVSCAVKLANSGELKSENITPKNVSQYNDIGYFLAEGGKFQESAKVLKEVINAVPDRTVAYLNLGDAYWGHADTTLAVMAYLKYSDLMRKDGKSEKAPKRVLDRSKYK